MMLQAFFTFQSAFQTGFSNSSASARGKKKNQQMWHFLQQKPQQRSLTKCCAVLLWWIFAFALPNIWASATAVSHHQAYDLKYRDSCRFKQSGLPHSSINIMKLLLNILRFIFDVWSALEMARWYCGWIKACNVQCEKRIAMDCKISHSSWNQSEVELCTRNVKLWLPCSVIDTISVLKATSQYLKTWLNLARFGGVAVLINLWSVYLTSFCSGLTWLEKLKYEYSWQITLLFY